MHKCLRCFEKIFFISLFYLLASLLVSCFDKAKLPQTLRATINLPTEIVSLDKEDGATLKVFTVELSTEDIKNFTVTNLSITHDQRSDYREVLICKKDDPTVCSPDKEHPRQFVTDELSLYSQPDGEIIAKVRACLDPKNALPGKALCGDFTESEPITLELTDSSESMNDLASADQTIAKSCEKMIKGAQEFAQDKTEKDSEAVQQAQVLAQNLDRSLTIPSCTELAKNIDDDGTDGAVILLAAAGATTVLGIGLAAHWAYRHRQVAKQTLEQENLSKKQKEEFAAQRQKLTEEQADLEKTIKENLAKQTELDLETNKLQTDLDKNQSELDALNSQKTAIEKELEEANKKTTAELEGKFQDTAKRLEDLEGQLQRKNKELDELKQKGPDAAELDTKSIEADIEALRKQKAEFMIKSAALQMKLSGNEQRIQKQLAELKEQSSQLADKITQTTAQQEALNKQKADLTNANITAKAQLQEKVAQKTSLQAEIAQLNTQLATKQAAQNKLTTDLAGKTQQKQAAQAAHTQAKAAYEKKKQDIANLEKKINESIESINKTIAANTSAIATTRENILKSQAVKDLKNTRYGQFVSDQSVIDALLNGQKGKFRPNDITITEAKTEISKEIAKLKTLQEPDVKAQDELAQLRAEKAKLEADLQQPTTPDTLKTQLDDIIAEETKLTTQLERATTKTTSLKEKINTKQKTIDELDTTIKTQEAAITKQTAELANLQDQLNGLADSSPGKAKLDADIAKKKIELALITKQKEKLQTTFETRKQELKTRQAELDANLEQTRTAHQSLVEQRQRTFTETEGRLTQELSNLNEDIKAQQDRLETEKQAIETETQKIEAEKTRLETEKMRLENEIKSKNDPTLRTQLEANKTQLDQLNTKRTELDGKLKISQDRIKTFDASTPRLSTDMPRVSTTTRRLGKIGLGAAAAGVLVGSIAAVMASQNLAADTGTKEGKFLQLLRDTMEEFRTQNQKIYDAYLKLL